MAGDVGAGLLGRGEDTAGAGRLGFSSSALEQPVSNNAPAITAVPAAVAAGRAVWPVRREGTTALFVIVGLPPSVGGGQLCAGLPRGGDNSWGRRAGRFRKGSGGAGAGHSGRPRG
ncbi:hypothetical protein San01_08620 [Streptomyces angustmyceticus]|uniref:Uncharacterized protein n=1 Tax=Streptomyces angustmyceticus TaxID=285578 RepID=A0A5J4LE18_9ACTN|nr:hypothetical protein San01_08620 [Streptomyces angustmyceticus]